jgi:hypothetical protein
MLNTSLISLDSLELILLIASAPDSYESRSGEHLAKLVHGMSYVQRYSEQVSVFE